MWEAIESNRRRSRILIGLMGLILIVLGYLVGAAIHAQMSGLDYLAADARGYADSLEQVGAGGDPAAIRSKLFPWLASPSALLNGGGFIGAGVAIIVWIMLTMFALWGGRAALLRTAGAIPIDREAAPRLFNVVEEMTIAAGLPKTPDVYLIEDDAPNAFAVGRDPDHAAVAVTSGLLRRMNRDELQGVVAHEIGHVQNLDVRFLTLASVMLGSIVMISEVFLRSLRYGVPRRRSSSKGGAGAAAVVAIIAIIFAILAPIAARLLFFACSRRREYLADASAARFTRYPEGLASALEKIGSRTISPKETSSSLAGLYIVNPLQAPSSTSVFATHPPLDARIRILRSMAGGAGYVDYEAAYRRVLGGKKPCMSAVFLGGESHLDARAASADRPDEQDAIVRSRETMDVIDRAANFLLLPCTCGVRLKLPPDMRTDSIKCPRCGQIQQTPRSQTTVAPISIPAGAVAEELEYHRKGGGWESFRCACDHTLQISPSFGGSSVSCPKCGRKTKVIA